MNSCDCRSFCRLMVHVIRRQIEKLTEVSDLSRFKWSWNVNSNLNIAVAVCFLKTSDVIRYIWQPQNLLSPHLTARLVQNIQRLPSMLHTAIISVQIKHELLVRSPINIYVFVLDVSYRKAWSYKALISSFLAFMSHHTARSLLRRGNELVNILGWQPYGRVGLLTSSQTFGKITNISALVSVCKLK